MGPIQRPCCDVKNNLKICNIKINDFLCMDKAQGKLYHTNYN